MSDEGKHVQQESSFNRVSRYLGIGGFGLGLAALILILLLTFGVLSPSSGTSLPCPTVTDSTDGTTGVGHLDTVSAYDLWLASGHDGTLQDFFDALVGKPGADGYMGSNGVNGAAGSDGNNGEDGASAYQLWLDAGNSGSEDDFLKSLVGAPGQTGAAGPTGAAGMDGLAGLSAYELWLLEGNRGDLQAFLNSLVGARGATGATGASGKPGATGATGATGPTGPAGQDGAAGLSAYQIWESQPANAGKTETQFLESLVGAAGICTVGDTGPAGPAGPKGDPGSGLPYNASFFDTTTQNNSGGEQLMTYNTADPWNEGITVPSATPSQITFAHPGVYNIQFSTQFEKTDSGTDFIDIWLKKNGVAVPMSATELRSWGNDDRLVAAWNFFVQADKAGDYFEIAWASADTHVAMLSTAGNGEPGIPSVILTVTQVK
jgi:hypothetical protein